MTKEQKKRLAELIGKVHNTMTKLNASEVKELQDLFGLLQKEADEKQEENDEKEKKDSFSEAFDRAFEKVGAEKKLNAELARKESFKKMTPNELNAKFDELEAFTEKAIAEMDAETAQLKKEREEREYYENYFKKYGNEL